MMDEKEYILLKELKDNNSHIPQRELAKKAGLSLGSTNLLIKRMINTGLIKMRKLNSRNLRYLLTKKGIETVIYKSIQYVKRTLTDIHSIKEKVQHLVKNLAEAGYTGVQLIGDSEMTEFFFYFCQKEGLEFNEVKQAVEKPGFFTVYGESIDQSGDGKNVFDILIEKGEIA
jgi:DNA-binding Lrp family transcriptional regulator